MNVVPAGMKGPVKFITAFHGENFAEYYFYRVTAYREPKKGEYYLSGAIVAAYEAPNDLSFKYNIVEKGPKAVQKTIWVPEGY